MDTFEVDDLRKLHNFKRLVMKHVPALSRQMYQEGCKRLNDATSDIANISRSSSLASIPESTLTGANVGDANSRRDADAADMDLSRSSIGSVDRALSPQRTLVDKAESESDPAAADVEVLEEAAETAEEDEEETVITVKRENSKFFDVRLKMVETFGSLSNISTSSGVSAAQISGPDDLSGAPVGSLIIAPKTSSSSSISSTSASPADVDIIRASRENSIENLLKLGKIKTDAPIHMTFQGAGLPLAQNEDIRDFEIPSGRINVTAAVQVLEIYRQGGRLSVSSVHRILRGAYRTIKELNNTVHLSITQHEKLTVVGDIHGQLPDLIHILDESGLPTKRHKYVFNGDFVDRGPMGVEVMVLLLALHTALPGKS